jgi:hypothetical protein
MTDPLSTGYAPVNGMDIYWESHGSAGTPLVVVHGGFGLATMSEGLIGQLAAGSRAQPGHRSTLQL